MATMPSYSQRWKDDAAQEAGRGGPLSRQAQAAEEAAREERLQEWRERTKRDNERRAAQRAQETTKQGIPGWAWVVGTLVAVSLLTGKPVLAGCSEPNRTPGGNIICNDGSVSYSEGSGTCSHHGGISYGSGDPGP
jgi:hypothetical protein